MADVNHAVSRGDGTHLGVLQKKETLRNLVRILSPADPHTRIVVVAGKNDGQRENQFPVSITRGAACENGTGCEHDPEKVDEMLEYAREGKCVKQQNGYVQSLEKGLFCRQDPQLQGGNFRLV
jgi:hypothetical protein